MNGMKEKGFVKCIEGTVPREPMARLEERGIPSERILTGSSFDGVLPVLERGDTVVVCSFSEVCRGVSSLLEVLGNVLEKEAVLVSLEEPWLNMATESCRWDTLLPGLTEFGKKLVAERTKAGLVRARAQGIRLGRPKGGSPEMDKRLQTCLALYRGSDLPVREICRVGGMHPRTFYRYLKEHGIPLSRKKRDAGDGPQ